MRGVARIFDAQSRPRLGLSERDVALRLRPRTGHVLLGAIGLTPSPHAQEEPRSAEEQMRLQCEESLLRANAVVGLIDAALGSERRTA